jgi:biotin carboxyl carrier protein
MRTTSWVRVPATRNDKEEHVEIEPLGEGRYRVTTASGTREVEAWPTASGVALRRDGVVTDVHAERREEHVRVAARGLRDDVHLLDGRTWALRTALGDDPGAVKPEIRSPMAGKVVLVRVAPGEHVEKDQTLLIIEAMKMENEIRSPGAGQVREVRVGAGDLVAAGDVLLAFDVDA